MGTTKKERIQHINQMLLEMASGNFFYRLERFAKNDTLEAISISLNMLAEEILETMHHQGFVNSNSPKVDIVQMSFVLDKEGKIEMANQQACTILSVLIKDIVGMPFESFLESSSKGTWAATQQQLLHKKVSETAIELKFQPKSGLLIPKIAYITSFMGLPTDAQKILITVIHHSNHQNKLDHALKQGVIQFTDNKKQAAKETPTAAQKSRVRLSFEDIRKIREGHDLILHNLEKDFPSLRDFALQLGTNEFKLKYGFRELYGTSVHRFLMNERFRKAQMMIQFSDQSLKSIANRNGFKSFSHFSRSFKKRYGYAPSALRKKSLHKDA